MSIKPISSSDRQLLALCQATCANLKAKYVSMNDIIPRVELFSITMDRAKGMRNHHEKMEKYGMRWLRYIKATVSENVWTIACDQAAARLLRKGQLSTLVTEMARATKGVAECQAISLHGCKELQAVGPYRVHIHPNNPINEQTKGLMERISHCFILVGVNQSDLDRVVTEETQTNIFDLLDKLNKGVILDASLNCVCLVSQYREKAGPLLEYIQKHQTTLVGEIGTMRSNPQFFEEVAPWVEKVCALAEQLLPTIRMSATTELYFRAAIVEGARQMVIAHGIISGRFSEVQWKRKGADIDAIEWTVWTQGPVAQVQAIGEHLKSIGAPASASKVKNKDAYAVILKDPDPLELSVLFATEQLFAAATGKLAGIITRYAEK